MAFVSINNLRKFTREDGRMASPIITITNRGVAYITRAVYDEIKPSTIDMEVDFEDGKIRLRTGDNLSRKLVGKVKHTFNVPVSVWKKIVPANDMNIKIHLTKSEDGWWYGSFKAED